VAPPPLLHSAVGGGNTAAATGPGSTDSLARLREGLSGRARLLLRRCSRFQAESVFCAADAKSSALALVAECVGRTTFSKPPTFLPVRIFGSSPHYRLLSWTSLESAGPLTLVASRLCNHTACYGRGVARSPGSESCRVGGQRHQRQVALFTQGVTKRCRTHDGGARMTLSGGRGRSRVASMDHIRVHGAPITPPRLPQPLGSPLRPLPPLTTPRARS
jgi:hypothetical protein